MSKAQTNKWTTEQIPDLTDKIVIVTGANSGIGYETAKALAEKNAEVIMACRNLDKANRAVEQIRRSVSKGKLRVIKLDLADFESIREFAREFKQSYHRLDCLFNNAGIMIPPFTRTAEGFEVQFGANHLGHFMLTGLLLDVIEQTPDARIVNVSSSAHRMGKGTIDFENLNAEKGYNPMQAYAQSKLANLLFTRELNTRMEKSGSDVVVTSAHPGWTVTGLQKGFLQGFSKLLGQRPPKGALPTLRAAFDPDSDRNDYFGPKGMAEMRGFPVKVDMSPAAKDERLARELWSVSEKLTGVEYGSNN